MPSVPNTCGSRRRADAQRADEWQERAIRGEAAADGALTRAERTGDEAPAKAIEWQGWSEADAALWHSGAVQRERKPRGDWRPRGSELAKCADCIWWLTKELRLEITAPCFPNAPCAA